MIENIILILVLLFFAFMAYYSFKISNENVKISQRCTCGKYDGECVSKIVVKSNGHMRRNVKEMLQCGKVQEQERKLRQLIEDGIIEIEEK